VFEKIEIQIDTPWKFNSLPLMPGPKRKPDHLPTIREGKVNQSPATEAVGRPQRGCTLPEIDIAPENGWLE